MRLFLHYYFVGNDCHESKNVGQIRDLEIDRVARFCCEPSQRFCDAELIPFPNAENPLRCEVKSFDDQGRHPCPGCLSCIERSAENSRGILNMFIHYNL